MFTGFFRFISLDDEFKFFFFERLQNLLIFFTASHMYTIYLCVGLDAIQNDNRETRHANELFLVPFAEDAHLQNSKIAF